MYAVIGYLYQKDKCLLRGMYEDLENFVEELKELNPKYVDRREFKVISPSGEIIKQWFRKWSELDYENSRRKIRKIYWRI